MPVVVATMTAKLEPVATVREILTRAANDVHDEPSCQLYSLHESGSTFVFVEQWADADVLQAHSTAPAIARMLKEGGDHLAVAPDVKTPTPVVAGDPDKGQLRH
jgi:quinol monooxygenase YgiN